jgi:hypothetical protein
MGWDWDYVLWNVDLPRLRSLNLYWKNNPPVHQLVAAYMNYEPKNDMPQLGAKQSVGTETPVAEADVETVFAGIPMRTIQKPAAKRYQ